MSFLNPLFLFGLAAAAVPILIHLFTRRRPRDQMFPSLEFLTEVNQSEIRRLRLRQWLLLLLRALAVAALALAMSRPALKGTSGGRSGAATTVVALVDQSGSMGAIASGGGATGDLVAQARRVVEDLLASLGPQDELLLVPYDAGPRPISPRPLSDLGRVRAAAQGLRATARTTDHLRALEFAARALEKSHALNRELFWISDFQAAGFATTGTTSGAASAPGALLAPPASFELPAGPWTAARAYLVPLVPASRANAGLVDAALAPGEGNAAIEITARNFGARAGDVSVEVRDSEKGDEIARGFVSLPDRGDGSTLLPLARLPEQGGIARLPDDALELDNRRAFAAGRSGTTRVLVREDGPPSAVRFALEAGSPASGIAVEAVDGATLPARVGEADVLVINDVPRLGPAELQAVLDFHRGGGGVFVILGTRADPAFWNDALLAPLGVGTLGPSDAANAGAAWRLERAVAGHPMLAGFPARPGEPLSTARFSTVRRLTPASGVRVLLAFDRAHPALVEAPRALAFAASLDPQTSDFPVSGAFLPLLHQAVKVLGRGTAAASLLPGERYSAPAGTGEWRIEDDQGHEVPSALVAESGASRLSSEPLERPGLYRVLQGGRVRGSFAVNPDPRESDLAPLAEPALLRAFPAGRAQVLRPGADLVRRVREARYGRELWSWFIILALALLAAETVIARTAMPDRARETRGAA